MSAVPTVDTAKIVSSNLLREDLKIEHAALNEGKHEAENDDDDEVIIFRERL